SIHAEISLRCGPDRSASSSWRRSYASCDSCDVAIGAGYRLRSRTKKGPRPKTGPLRELLQELVQLVQLPELESFEPASLNLPLTWSFRKTTAAITASAISATRRMYSTIDAPFSSLANFASSHVRNTNRFIGHSPSFSMTGARQGTHCLFVKGLRPSPRGA